MKFSQLIKNIIGWPLKLKPILLAYSEIEVVDWLRVSRVVGLAVKRQKRKRQKITILAFLALKTLFFQKIIGLLLRKIFFR
jgi:hypothetical protein